MAQDRELLSIGQIRRVLGKLEPHQRLIVLQYVSQSECSAQEAAKEQHMERVAETLGRVGSGAVQGNGGIGMS